MTLDLSSLRFDAGGLLPVVVQDAGSGAVLMLAYANREAIEKTLTTGQAIGYGLIQKQETTPRPPVPGGPPRPGPAGPRPR